MAFNTLRKTQRGDVSLVHMLILVVIVVGLFVAFKKDFFPSPESIPGFNTVKEKLSSISISVNNNSATPSSNSVPPAPKVTDPNTQVANPAYRHMETAPDYGSNEKEAEYRHLIDDNDPIELVSQEKPKPVVHKPAPPKFPSLLKQGYYTVQVTATYNSKTAYGMRRELQADGYQAYIQEQEDREGRMFRVRVGKYQNLNNARAIRDQIRRRYPDTMNDSYVLKRDSE